MHAEILAICKHARITGPDLEIAGPFDEMAAGGVPGHATFYVATRVRVPAPYAPKHFFEFVLVDDDGAEVAPRLGCEVGFPPNAAGESMAVNLCIEYGVTFSRFGDYQMDLFADRDLCASVPLRICQATVTR